MAIIMTIDRNQKNTMNDKNGLAALSVPEYDMRMRNTIPIMIRSQILDIITDKMVAPIITKIFAMGLISSKIPPLFVHMNGENILLKSKGLNPHYYSIAPAFLSSIIIP